MKAIRLASALAVAAGLFAADAKATTEQWWSFDFDDAGMDMETLTNANTAAWSNTGVWVSEETDESSILDADDGKYWNNSQCLKLDTQGTELTWTTTGKDATRPEGTRTLIDADMYLVGAEDEPTGFDNGDVQAAIFLKNIVDTNDVTTSKLCVYTYDGSVGVDAPVWVPLDAVVTDGQWYHVQVVVDYSESVGMVSVYVDGTLAADEGGATSWPIASNSDQVKHITSVSFKGTGAIDNFVGTVEADATVSYLFTGATFVDGVASADAPQYSAPLAPSVVGTPAEFSTDTILFDAVSGDMSATLTSVVITTFDGEGVATNTTYAFEYDENEGDVVAPAGAPAGMFDVDSGLITVVVPTANATAGAGTNEIQIVQFCYTSIGGGAGPDPVEPGQGLSAADGLPVEMLPAGTEVGGVPLAEDTFVVRFCGQAGVTYVLVGSDTPVVADWTAVPQTGDSVTCVNDGDVITLTVPMDEDAQFFRIKATK